MFPILGHFKLLIDVPVIIFKNKSLIRVIIMSKKKIGRDAGTGKFKSVKDAQKDKKGSVEYSGESVPLILEESVPPNSGWI